MYANNSRDLQGLDRPDESPDDHLWTTLEAIERDLLIAIACLEQTATPATPTRLKLELKRWHPDLAYDQLHAALRTLTTENYLTEQPAASTYRTTKTAINLLETYSQALHRLTNNHPKTFTITLEHPITPGDLERAYCILEAHR